MKQVITKKQWEELSDEEKTALHNEYIRISTGNFTIEELNLGQLIEYLGDDLEAIYRNSKDYNVEIMFNGFERKELIDALWEATKYKLRNK